MSEMVRIVGPPGAGKTTFLSRQIERAAEKYPADLVMVCSFTRAAVRELLVQLKPEEAATVMHSLVLQATFDGEATLWCPLGEFFGAGARLRPVQDWWRNVGADGLLSARWIMPYAKSGHLAIKNLADHDVAVKISAPTGKWTWDDRSMLFHANWHGQLEIPTQPRSDWNYIEIQGQGRYVGDSLTVFSPSKAWYGEGDERIYLDGAALPAHIGTGTEDYYGYAWGMADFFNSPFISVPQRDIPNHDDWKAYTTTSRVRPLDSIPFRTALKHDMEIWHWANCKVDYAVGTFWYARPGAKHNREPQPTEAAAAIRALPGS